MDENKHYLQIDLIKALAIVSVLIIHSIPPYYSRSPVSIFTIEQAVPVFLLIMGLNGAMSFKRRSYINLKQMYGLKYFKTRIIRFLIPFLIIFIVSLILGLIIHYNYYVGILSLVGYLPLSGPGNYFITIVLEFIFVFPIIYYFYKRNPMILLVSSFIVSLLFELLANQLHMNGKTYIYNACVLRYLFVIALGIYAADTLKTTNLSFFKKNKKIWVLILISIAYMLWVSALGNHITIIPEYWQPMIVFSFFYTFFLCALGFHYLPKISNKFFDKISVIGKASYHIYLVQIVAFYISSSIPSITRLFPKIVVSICGIFFILAIGIAFYVIEKKLSYKHF